MLEPVATVMVPRLPVVVPEIASRAERSVREGWSHGWRARSWDREAPIWPHAEGAAHYGWGETARLGTLVDVYG